MLTSVQNPLVKAIRKLHQGKGRRSQQQFLLEGTHLIQEALLAKYPIDVVCYTPAWAERYGDLVAALAQTAQRIEVVADNVIQALATTVHPDGVVAVAPQRPWHSNSATPPTLGLLVETLQDPGNLGTIIRTAAAAGVDGLWLSADSVAPDHPKVLRASAGQWFRLPLWITEDPVQQMTTWQAAGVQLVATNAAATQRFWNVDLTQPTVFLLGNEGAGLSAPLQHYATTQVSIPMQADVESLNVAVAAALLMYEACRQRQSG
jgi:TrmH family RNA methyltransferase